MKSFLSITALALVLAPQFSEAQLSSVPRRLRASDSFTANASKEWGRQESTSNKNKRQRKLTVERILEEGSMSLSMSLPMSMPEVDTTDVLVVDNSGDEGSDETDAPFESVDTGKGESEPELSEVFPLAPEEKESSKDTAEEETEDEETLEGEFIDQKLECVY